MRDRVTEPTLQRFLRELGRASGEPVRIYLTGGATAVLEGWRSSTLDVDIKLDPDLDIVLQALPALKERLRINVELASPDDFIPALPSWQERSTFIVQHGQTHYFHYDLRAQALSKVERGHAMDRSDVLNMFERGLVDPEELLRVFDEIEPRLFRYPSLDPEQFRRKVEEMVAEWRETKGQ